MPLLQWAEVRARPRASADATIAYGPAPSQFVELWRPAGADPVPVVVLIHGGCWTASIADVTITAYAAEDLRRRGIAVWNVEYRRLGEDGAGYPGTYQDVAAALDRLKVEAAGRGLLAGPVVVVGHSAGGHLALWAAARHRLPPASPLWVADPLPVRAVIDLAGIANLETDTDTACGAETVAAMAGPASADRPDPFADTSPFHLAPTGVPTWVIHGTEDTVVRPEIGDAFARHAQALGDDVTVLRPPGGHVEEVVPGAEAWETAADLIVRLARA